LCEKLGISPYEYLVIKEILVREAVKENFIRKDFAENTLKLGKKIIFIYLGNNFYIQLDKERVNGIFDFLVSHNYILEK
jgi:hypothetical protein